MSLETRVIVSEFDAKFVLETESILGANAVQGVKQFYDMLRKAGHPEQAAITLTCSYWGIDKMYHPRPTVRRAVVTQE